MSWSCTLVFHVRPAAIFDSLGEFCRLQSLHLAWMALLKLRAPSLVATYLGDGLSERFGGAQLHKAFAVFTIVLEIFMMANNAATLFQH